MKKTNNKKPPWLKVKLPGGEDYNRVNKLVHAGGLHTVCQSAKCPNIGECWSRRTATFMILGDVCTRNCRFCAVPDGAPSPVDSDEPLLVAQAVKTLDLKYAVITSVTRDDLEDGGAQHFAETIMAIRQQQPNCKVEVLIPDFNGSYNALQTVLQTKPDVLNHNLETVPRLYPQARPMADYNQSLQLLKRAHERGAITKTGLMVGLGENLDEIYQVMEQVINVSCKMLTIGQYLQPTKNHLPVQRFVNPDEFTQLKKHGLDMGFSHIEAGPLVRSSYHADKQFDESCQDF